MELLNKSCIVATCAMSSTILCNFCQQNVCINHLNEHEKQCNNHSFSLDDDIYTLSNRLNKFSINESIFVKNLEQWRIESYKTIDKFYELKYNEYVRKTQEEIDQLKETVASLSNDLDAAEDYIDWVKETIQSIHQQLDELKNYQYKFPPLKIENSTMISLPSICDIKRHPTPLKELFSSISLSDELYSPLSPSISFNYIEQSNKQTMKISSDNWYSLATNEIHLLITSKTNLYLIDHSLTIKNKKSFVQIGIKDICWSKILSRFIIISPKEIYILDEKSMNLELTSINLINNNTWERGTCSETILFISTYGENPFIVEYNFLPSIHFNKRYQTSIICGENEIINDIKCNNISIGLIIDNGFINQSRLELCSIKSFERIWSINLGRGWGYRCSFINNHYWIVIDSYNNRFIRIVNNGIIDITEDYSTKPFNVVDWNEQKIVIRTNEGINIHEYK